MAAISASVQPTNASRVTAVPRKSLNVTPTMPAAACVIRQEARKPLTVHGLPLELAQSVIASWAGAAARMAVSGAGQGQNTGSPVLDRLVAISFAL